MTQGIGQVFMKFWEYIDYGASKINVDRLALAYVPFTFPVLNLDN